MLLKKMLMLIVMIMSLVSAVSSEGLKGQNSFVDGEESYRLYIKISQN